MNLHHDLAPTARPGWTWLLVPVLAFLALHGLLLIHDLNDPDAIFSGDRALSRWSTLQGYLELASERGATAAVLHYNQPGDWLVHTWIYQAGGLGLVIGLQLLAAFGGLLATRWLVRELGGSRRAAMIAGLFYVLLPASVMSPHQLATETFFTTSFVVGSAMLAAAMRRGHAGLLWLAVLPWAIGAFIRPQGLLFLPLAAVLLAIWHPQLRRGALGASLLCLALFPGAWLAWRYAHTGEFGMGPWDADFGVGFQIRANRALELLGLIEWAERDQVTAPRLTAGEFLALVAQYPVAFLRTYISDLVNLAANPGANALFGLYLKLFPTPPDPFQWKLLLDEAGAWAVVKAIADEGLGFLAVFLLLGLLHAVVVVGAVIGIVAGCRSAANRPVTVLVLMLTLVSLGVVFVAGMIRWTHRAPAEPLVAAFAGIGLCSLAAWGSARRRGGTVTPAPAAET